MKILFAILVLAALGWIGFNVQRSESRATEAQHERARKAKAYLDCMSQVKANAKANAYDNNTDYCETLKEDGQ